MLHPCQTGCDSDIYAVPIVCPDSLDRSVQNVAMQGQQNIAMYMCNTLHGIDLKSPANFPTPSDAVYIDQKL